MAITQIFGSIQLPFTNRGMWLLAPQRNGHRPSSPKGKCDALLVRSWEKGLWGFRRWLKTMGYTRGLTSGRMGYSHVEKYGVYIYINMYILYYIIFLLYYIILYIYIHVSNLIVVGLIEHVLKHRLMCSYLSPCWPNQSDQSPNHQGFQDESLPGHLGRGWIHIFPWLFQSTFSNFPTTQMWLLKQIHSSKPDFEWFLSWVLEKTRILWGLSLMLLVIYSRCS